MGREKNTVIHLLAGGAAGIVESSCCHPLDTVKVRVQLQRTEACTPSGTMSTAMRIVNNEGFLALYRGLSAVMAGIVPKMAVRFSAFESYKNWLGASDGGIKGKLVVRHYDGCICTESVALQEASRIASEDGH